MIKFSLDCKTLEAYPRYVELPAVPNVGNTVWSNNRTYQVQAVEFDAYAEIVALKVAEVR